MTRDEMLAEIINLTLRTAPDLEAEVTPDSSFEELGMDSLTRIDLLAAVEKAFSLSVPDEKVGDLLRVSDVADFLLAHKAGV
ncbi:phosphopantetheine-binding protein [Streptomyces sp. SID10815]|uniref:Carrier domain-containing protein n=1 Tax=Streptomyces similanensis TaxID=1274988 RepID=A0ABP9KG08_9ACTN|nr:phosphopantetheine-binding protein [Streptomyces sp. SID10815]